MITVNIPEEILDDNTLSLGAFKVYCKLLQFEMSDVSGDDVRRTTTLYASSWVEYLMELNKNGYGIIISIFNHKGDRIKVWYKLRKRKPRSGDTAKVSYYLDEEYCLNKIEKFILHSDEIIVIEDDEEFNAHKQYVSPIVDIIRKRKKFQMHFVIDMKKQF